MVSRIASTPLSSMELSILYRSLRSSGSQQASSWTQASLFASLVATLYVPHRLLKKPHSSVVMPLETVGLGSFSGLATVSLFGG